MGTGTILALVGFGSASLIGVLYFTKESIKNLTRNVPQPPAAKRQPPAQNKSAYTPPPPPPQGGQQWQAELTKGIFGLVGKGLDKFGWGNK